MPRANLEVAAAFRELADLEEMTGADRFRVLAYRRLADSVAGTAIDISKLSQPELLKLRGIGRGTVGKVQEILETGAMAHLEQLRAQFPPGVKELTRLGGIGPKKAVLICRELGVTGIADLKEAAEAGRLREIPGLGEKTEQNILAAISRYSVTEHRILVSEALRIAEEIVDLLNGEPAVEEAAYAGSLRRMKETIGDLDILVASARPTEVVEAFASLPRVARVSARGSTKCSVVTDDGVEVDLRVVAPDEFEAAMQYFTGSQEHNVRVREHAVKLGFKLSEYGLFRVRENGTPVAGDPVKVAGTTEDEVYGGLGMQTPPPTLRENRGEVEAAMAGRLPELVEVSDMRGDLQSHSNYSDGRATMEQMALAAAGRGYEYYAVTDHGRDLRLKSLSLDDIDRQAAEVRELNQKLKGKITILHGCELNIGPEGELDYPDEVLARFDILVASVHHAMKDDSEKMTRRVLRAVEHPLVNILGHPTGRRIGRREAFEFDIPLVAKAAAANNVALEINSNPQ
ncbi:MAG: PHP domain-containing protein, partial [Actinomycetota bacterium]